MMGDMPWKEAVARLDGFGMLLAIVAGDQRGKSSWVLRGS